MSTDPGIWGWTSDIGQYGFTVTFSLGLAPEEVLSHYGAAAGGPEWLTREQTWTSYPPNYGGTRLRAGTLGRWGFCFEEGGSEGIATNTLGGLSGDTETISLFTLGGTSSFIYLKDGQGIEAFEPGLPYTLRGQEPHKFWDDTQKILTRAHQTAPMLPAHAILQAIAKHVRGLLDRATLEGPLLTAFRPGAGQAATNPHFDDASARPQPAPHPQAHPQPQPQHAPGQPVRSYPGPLSPVSSNTAPLPVMVLPTATSDLGYDRFRGARAS